MLTLIITLWIAAASAGDGVAVRPDRPGQATGSRAKCLRPPPCRPRKTSRTAPGGPIGLISARRSDRR